MFQAMMEGIKEESVGYLFNLEVQVEQQVEEVPVEDEKPSLEKTDAVPAQAGASRPEIRAKGLEAPQRRDRLHFSAPTVDGEGGIVEGDLPEDEPVRSEADGLTRAERRKQQGKTSRRRKK